MARRNTFMRNPVNGFQRKLLTKRKLKKKRKEKPLRNLPQRLLKVGVRSRRRRKMKFKKMNLTHLNILK